MSKQLFEQFHHDARYRIDSFNSDLINMSNEFKTYTRLPMYSSMRYHELTLNSGGLKNDIRQLELYFYELIQKQPYVSSITFIDNQSLEVFKVERKGISNKLRDLSLNKKVTLLVDLEKEEILTSAIRSDEKIEGFIIWIPVFVSSHTRYGLMRFELDRQLIIEKMTSLLSFEGDSACILDKNNTLVISRGEDGLCMTKTENIWKVHQELELPGLDWKLGIVANNSSFLKETRSLEGLVFLVIFPVIALASFIFTLVFSRHIVTDIKKLVTAAKNIGENKPLTSVPLSREDELGVLAMELKRSSDLIEKNKKHLEEKNSELEAFSYTLAHDLRSPLRSIASFSQILQEEHKEKLDTEGLNFLQRIILASNRMSILIEDILELARVTQSELRITKVNLSDLAETILDQLKVRNDKRELNAIIKKDQTVNGDIQLLRLILENLLGNAWKYTGKNSLSEIEFGSLLKDGVRVYFIRDNGAGFEMKYVDKLFTPFQRLHTLSEFAGTGVGLASVKRMITLHNGRVWIESQKDKGTTVYFTLWETPADKLNIKDI